MFVHPTSDVHPSVEIKPNTKVWQCCVVLEGAVIGENCNLCAHTLVEGGVVIGNNTTVKSGVYLWSGVTLENDVFLGPNATFTNDLYPRSKVYPDDFMRTLVKAHASIGANATILPGVTIGQYAMVGAGSVVTRDVPDYAVVQGNPARVVRMLDEKSYG